MKKILSIAMATALAAVAAGSIGAIALTSSASAADDAPAAVYLVPGEGHALTGLQKADATALNAEGDVYVAGAAGTALPAPTTEQKDEEGNAFVFQGWWYIVDATVTYTETVPEVTETTYLYADFRAQLSQHKDPAPPTSTPAALRHYMHVEHTDTGEEENIPLRISGTDFSTALDVGYGHAVQFYNEYFELRPGDLVQFWVSGVQLKEPQCMPLTRLMGNGYYKAGYEFAVSGSNKTSAYLTTYNSVVPAGDTAFLRVEEPTFKYVGTQAQHFRIYVKLYDDGGWINIYMEKK